MGPIQTYYYLALIGIVFFSLAMIFVGVGIRHVGRLYRESDDRLVAWLVTGAIVLVFLVITLTSIGVIVGLSTRGAQS